MPKGRLLFLKTCEAAGVKAPLNALTLTWLLAIRPAQGRTTCDVDAMVEAIAITVLQTSQKPDGIKRINSDLTRIKFLQITPLNIIFPPLELTS